jgi:hypothetical protein
MQPTPQRTLPANASPRSDGPAALLEETTMNVPFDLQHFLTFGIHEGRAAVDDRLWR